MKVTICLRVPSRCVALPPRRLAAPSSANRDPAQSSKRRAWAALAAMWAIAGAARADPLSGYLPLNLEPEIERQIERVLILGDEPILKRPIPVELVYAALPAACKIDQPLCTRVKHYLDRYAHDYGLTHASLTGSYSHGANVVIPNEHGLMNDDHWEVSAQGYVQPNDYLLASAGAIAYSGRTQPTGSMLSVGFSGAQLDVGYRDHWFSPATDSTMVMSTESPTMLSATLSNWEPLTRLGIQYEFFLAQMSQTGSNSGASVPGDNIIYNGVASRGNPHLFGTQVSIEPISGWSIGVNRLMQYGGGSGLPDSARFLLRDFFKPSGLSQLEGKQEASYDSRFIFPGKTPFAVYFQYAGTENSDGGSYLLGNSALTAGIDFPRIWHHFDLTYEIAEWQDVWYNSGIYLDGTTNDGLVLGNWGADQRRFGDGMGARSQMLRIGWLPPFGGYLEERVRTLVNQTYSDVGIQRVYYSGEPPAYPYHHYYEFDVTYSRPWNDLTVGGEVTAGRDVYGQSFTRLSGFVRYGGESRWRDEGPDNDSTSGGSTDRGAEVFVNGGLNVNQVHVNLGPPYPVTTTSVGVDPHFAVGARRTVSANNDLGVRLELDEVDGHALTGVRAIDFRHRYNESLALGLFLGADRYDLATPAYSLYGGLGLEWRNFLPRSLPMWDVGVDLRYAQNVARDRILASDPYSTRPDIFYKIPSAVLYLGRHF